MTAMRVVPAFDPFEDGGGELRSAGPVVLVEELTLETGEERFGDAVDAPICQDASTKSFEVRSVGRVEPGWRR